MRERGAMAARIPYRLVAASLLLAACANQAAPTPAAESSPPKFGMEVRASLPPAGTEATVPVPPVVGLEFEDAVNTLRASGLDFGSVYAQPAHGDPWSVIKQNPKPGTLMASGGRVNLILVLQGRPAERGGWSAVWCIPEADELDNPYCLGKLFKY